MRFYSFVMKNVGRRRVRSLLTILGMAIAVGAVVSLVGIATGFQNSFMAIYQRQKVDLIVEQMNVKDKLTSRLAESAGEKIAAIPGVHEVNTGLVSLISMEGVGPVGACSKVGPSIRATCSGWTSSAATGSRPMTSGVCCWGRPWQVNWKRASATK